MVAGSTRAGMTGRSIRQESATRTFIDGLRRSAYCAADDRRIRIGTWIRPTRPVLSLALNHALCLVVEARSMTGKAEPEERQYLVARGDRRFAGFVDQVGGDYVMRARHVA